jgi:hypothetical protein
MVAIGVALALAIVDQAPAGILSMTAKLSCRSLSHD